MSTEQSAGSGAVSPPELTPPAAAEPAAGPIRLQAASLHEAAAQAAALLGVSPEQLELEVERTERVGFLGLSGQRLHVVARRKVVAADGQFKLTWARGSLFLEVLRPRGSGRPVAEFAVREAVAALPLDRQDQDALHRAVREANGELVMVGEVCPSTEPAADAPAAVRVTEDAMAAYLLPWAHDPTQPLDMQLSTAILAEARVTYGIDEATLQRVASEPFAVPTIVARGTPPEDGTDAEIDWPIDPAQDNGGLRAPRVLEDGRVDYRDLGGMASVPRGAVLATKVPATPGEPGRTVRGEERPPTPGHDFPLQDVAGPNTEVSADGSTLLSAIAGLVTRIDERVTVTLIQTVEGDVDFNIGNVTFEGSIVVKGGIKPGFRVHATGAVRIQGDIDCAHVEAGGDLSVAGGIIGEPTTTIKAGGGVQAKYLHSVQVQAGGRVKIDTEISQATVLCEDVVEVNGRIVSGVVRARRGLIAETLGSATRTETRIEVARGVEPSPEEVAVPGYRPPTIVVRRTVHPGVMIWLGRAHRAIDKELPAVTFREQAHTIVVSLALPGRP